MKIKNIKKSGTIAGIVAAMLIVIALNWIVICGIVKLITLCFGWTFSWAIATGIWLMMILLRMVFVQSSSSKKVR